MGRVKSALAIKPIGRFDEQTARLLQVAALDRGDPALHKLFILDFIEVETKGIFGIVHCAYSLIGKARAVKPPVYPETILRGAAIIPPPAALRFRAESGAWRLAARPLYAAPAGRYTPQQPPGCLKNR